MSKKQERQERPRTVAASQVDIRTWASSAEILARQLSTLVQSMDLVGYTGEIEFDGAHGLSGRFTELHRICGKLVGEVLEDVPRWVASHQPIPESIPETGANTRVSGTPSPSITRRCSITWYARGVTCQCPTSRRRIRNSEKCRDLPCFFAFEAVAQSCARQATALMFTWILSAESGRAVRG